MTQPVLIRTSRGGGVADARGVIVGSEKQDTGFAGAGGALLLERCSGGVAMHPNGCASDSAGWRVLAVGKSTEVQRHEAAAGAFVIDAGDAVLVPGMVNAHTHLDLTHIGPRALASATMSPGECGGFETRDDSFVAWIEMIRRERHTDPALIARSVERGCALSRSAGVVAIGDIAGAPRGRSSLVPARAMSRAGMMGVSFLEFFAIGRGLWTFQTWLQKLLASAAIETAERGLGVRIGLQPHAPNTVDARAYQWATAYAARAGLTLCSHVGESAAEAEFVRHARGPQRELLERLGLWDDDILTQIRREGHASHPVVHALNAMAAHSSPLLVHVNDLGVGDERKRLIERLARANATVVYCPRASAYFGAHEVFGPHGYRELLEAGVNVALGTDSIVNLPASSATAVGDEAMVDGRAEPPRGPGRGMSVWDECRLLFERDGTDALTLLSMATTRGARALGLDERLFLFTPGERVAGVVRVGGGKADERGSNNPASVGVLEQALRSDQPAALVVGPKGMEHR